MTEISGNTQEESSTPCYIVSVNSSNLEEKISSEFLPIIRTLSASPQLLQEMRIKVVS